MRETTVQNIFPADTPPLAEKRRNVRSFVPIAGVFRHYRQPFPHSFPIGFSTFEMSFPHSFPQAVQNSQKKRKQTALLRGIISLFSHGKSKRLFHPAAHLMFSESAGKRGKNVVKNSPEKNFEKNQKNFQKGIDK